MSNSTTRGMCANVEGTPCANPASKVCSRCHLVQYCSQGCQRSHYSLHKNDCNSPYQKQSWKPAWDVEGRSPAFVGGCSDENFSSIASHGAKKYLWGNVPALDILNMTQNEGPDVSSPLSLLFAASGDLRNVVKTLAQLPNSYTAQCEVVINDKDFDIVSRNAILLLIALSCPTDVAAEAILHIWYSAFITQDIFNLLQEKVKPLIDDVCKKIQNKPATALQSKSWVVGQGTVQLVLEKGMWQALQAFFNIPGGLSKSNAEAIMVATAFAPERKDYIERFLYARPPGWRVGAIRFRKEGILQPFGASTALFTLPNPTIFQSRNFWPMMDSANPLDGWPIEEIMGRAPTKNDLYGGMHHLVKDFFRRFCDGITLRPTRFQLLHVDAMELPGILARLSKDQPLSFNRIEVSNIVDACYLGTAKTVSTFAPLLQPKSQNPHAAILTLYLNAAHEIDQTAAMKNLQTEMKQVSSYFPSLNPEVMRNTNSCDMLKAFEACAYFGDFVALFNKYEKHFDFRSIGKATGLQVRDENRIVDKWPLRLKRGASKQEFDIMLASGHVRSERYVEWERVE